MMIAIAGIVFLAALSFGLGAYFRVGEADIGKASGIWDRANVKISQFIGDDRISDDVARDVAIFAALSGCGCFTTASIKEFFKIRAFRSIQEPSSLPQLDDLSDQQQHALADILGDLILFDSYHAPIRGRIFRALVRAVQVRTAAAKAKQNELEQIQTAMVSAHTVADRAARHGKVPRELLVV